MVLQTANGCLTQNLRADAGSHREKAATLRDAAKTEPSGSIVDDLDVLR